MELPVDVLPSVDGTVLDPLPEGTESEDVGDPAGELDGEAAALQLLRGGV